MTRRKPEHFRIHALKRTYNRNTNTFTINISYETAPATQTDRTKQVAEAFGLGADQTQKFTLYDNVTLKIRPTDIVLITGDSGSGKSALLKAIKTDLGNEAQDAKDITINTNQHIIETIGTNTTQAIETRSKVLKGNLQQLQQQISTISRIVIHPKYRSIGLGAKLVNETLAQAETPCVETVAVMARYNPFFEKAGMQRIAESTPSPHVTNALQQLDSLGFDVALLANVQYCESKVSEVGCEAVSAVLEALSKRDAAVRRRLAGLRSVYPKHEEFVAKICALDAAGLALALKRLSFMAQAKVYLFWRKEQAG